MTEILLTIAGCVIGIAWLTLQAVGFIAAAGVICFIIILILNGGLPNDNRNR